MAPFSMLVIYLLIWWVTLFAVLPIGVKGQAEEGTIVKGSEPGAPVESRMKRKVILTTIIATIIWAITCLVIIKGWVNLEQFYILEDIPQQT